jgi:hypothetical protein
MSSRDEILPGGEPFITPAPCAPALPSSSAVPAPDNRRRTLTLLLAPGRGPWLSDDVPLSRVASTLEGCFDAPDFRVRLRSCPRKFPLLCTAARATSRRLAPFSAAESDPVRANRADTFGLC